MLHSLRKRLIKEAKRQFALDYLGNKCKSCDSTSKLEFDHIDPSTKKYTLAVIFDYSLKIIETELEKCQLLCKSCHIKKTLAERTYLVKSDHGDASYYRNYNCRCSDCSKANTLYYRNRRLVAA